MVEKKPEVPRLVELSAEMKGQLKNLDKDIASAERAMAALDEIGMDTRALKEKLSWAKDTREILLKEFG